jgi:hypothetical protein
MQRRASNCAVGFLCVTAFLALLGVLGLLVSPSRKELLSCAFVRATVDLAPPSSLGEGSAFRFAFVTQSTTSATSADCAFYDSVVNAEASGFTFLGRPITWQAICCTATTNAIAPGRLPSDSIPIFLVNGAKVVSNSALLWNTGYVQNGADNVLLLSQLSYSLTQPVQTSQNSGSYVWVGCNWPDGTAAVGATLGSSNPGFGVTWGFDGSWSGAGTSSSNIHYRLYGYSNVLFLPCLLYCCQTGTYALANGTCVSCPANTYNNLFNQSSCTACGSYSFASPGSVTCSVCSAGTYALANGTCVSCPVNTYNNLVNQTSCTACGSYSFASPGSVTCSVCSAGTYALANGTCVSCPVNTYNNLVNQTSCTACETLHYAPPGSTICCPIGWPPSDDGSICFNPNPTMYFDAVRDVNNNQWWEDLAQPTSGGNLLLGAAARVVTNSGYPATGYAYELTGSAMMFVSGLSTSGVEFSSIISGAYSTSATFELWLRPLSFPLASSTQAQVLYQFGGVSYGNCYAGLSLVLYRSTLMLVQSPNGISTCDAGFTISYDIGQSWVEFQQVVVVVDTSSGWSYLYFNGILAGREKSILLRANYNWALAGRCGWNPLVDGSVLAGPCVYNGFGTFCPGISGMVGQCLNLAAFEGISSIASFQGQMAIFRYFQGRAYGVGAVQQLYQNITGATYCLPGLFPNVTSGVCENCSPGFYRGAGSSFPLFYCSPCPQGQFSSNGAAICTPCAAGSYQDQTGQPACKPVSAGTYQPATGTTADSTLYCPAGQYSPPGFGGGGTPCIPCSPGYWSAARQPNSCIACISGTYNYRSGSPTIVDCQSCPKFGQASPLGSVNASQCYCPVGTIEDSTQCNCPLGYFYNLLSGVCTSCTATSYKDFVGNGPCIACPLGSSVPLAAQPGIGVSNCSVCGGFGQIGTAAGCVCDAGMGFINGFCVACTANFYKSTIGNSPCSSCPTHAAVPVGLQPAIFFASCVCPWNSTLSVDATYCNCGAGFEWNGFICSPCSLSTYKGAVGDGPCLSCPSGASVPLILRPATSVTSCDCPPNNQLDPTMSFCQCSPGYFLSSGSCIACVGATYKDTPGNQACLMCPTHASVASQPATNAINCVCPSNSTLSGGTCNCNPGYEWNGASCSACSSSYYKSVFGDGPCLSCPAASTVPIAFRPATNVSQCACNAFSQLDPTGLFCQCNAGYTSVFGQCVQCPSNSYKPFVGNQACTPCGGSAIVLAPPGLTLNDCKCAAVGSVSSGGGGCVCDFGYTLSSSSGTCVSCFGASYKDVTGDQPCVACPTHAVVAQQPAISSSACVCPLNSTLAGGACNCDPGFEYTNGVCSACSAFSWKSATGTN